MFIQLKENIKLIAKLNWRRGRQWWLNLYFYLWKGKRKNKIELQIIHVQKLCYREEK